MKFLSAHFLLALVAVLVGYFVCKRFPTLLDGVPILDGRVPGQSM